MSDTHSHDISKHIRTYVLVFLALLVGTVITVTMDFVHLPSVPMTIAIALFIAIVKASLVAGFFMHLISEKKAVYAVLLTTVFFFAGMMFLTVWARDEMPSGTTYTKSSKTAVVAPHAGAKEEHPK